MGAKTKRQRGMFAAATNKVKGTPKMTFGERNNMAINAVSQDLNPKQKAKKKAKKMPAFMA